MILLHDQATMAHALTLPLDPLLLALLRERIASLTAGEHDLTEWTEFLIVEADDTESDIVREVGFSPLVEPIDGFRFPDPAFHPFWDLLADRGGWFEMIVTFGSTFAYVLLIEDSMTKDSEIIVMCRKMFRKQKTQSIS